MVIAMTELHVRSHNFTLSHHLLIHAFVHVMKNSWYSTSTLAPAVCVCMCACVFVCARLCECVYACVSV